MAYCTTADLENAIPADILERLTDDASAGAADTNKLEEAIDEAAGEIDGYLAGRYSVPLDATAVPQIIKKFNKDIAIYNLYGRYRPSALETWKDRHDSAIRYLEKVADGRITLGIQPPPDAPAASDYEQGATVSVRDKDFDSDTMEKY